MYEYVKNRMQPKVRWTSMVSFFSRTLKWTFGYQNNNSIEIILKSIVKYLIFGELLSVYISLIDNSDLIDSSDLIIVSLASLSLRLKYV